MTLRNWAARGLHKLLQIPDESEIKKMMTGRATKLESQFRLTYSMILNLLRVEDLKVGCCLMCTQNVDCMCMSLSKVSTAAVPKLHSRSLLFKGLLQGRVPLWQQLCGRCLPVWLHH